MQLDSGEFIIDQHPILKKISLPIKETILNVEDKWYYVIPMRDPNLPLPIEFIKGKLIAGYQLVLEDRWLTELKNTYTVTINSATLKNVYKDLEKL